MYQLDRFVAAQESVYQQVVKELSAGRKGSHWMWFIFPQLAGLGSSAMAQHYAISGLDEARAYLAHPVLGARLRACCALVLAVQGATVHGIFGSPDNMKFHSSMTLFAQVAPDEALFRACLDKYFGGVPDQATLDLLHKEKQ
ncbi:DUF1810 domain-containing protein [Duganella sp. Root1480D1]|uniref:DUF1810 domain-containing protein n=1 Tax=Duganella sp. Root1480D1 TaxID=1736471 RepID=UPI00070E0187|nr:DUF1810 domain-containing protein [Duganella sp. Root1480D1]KQZ44973.1 calpastatin [Duganella sp. Root1480D1]